MRFQLEMRPADGDATPSAELSYRPRRMARIVASMITSHMAVDAGPPPKFPMWAVYGVSDFDSAGRPVGGRAKDYEAELARILAYHGPSDEPVIPAHKLRTNLGWHVTVAECAAAVHAFDEWTERNLGLPNAFGPLLLPFLRLAAVGDGFEVH